MGLGLFTKSLGSIGAEPKLGGRAEALAPRDRLMDDLDDDGRAAMTKVAHRRTGAVFCARSKNRAGGPGADVGVRPTLPRWWQRACNQMPR